VKPSPLALLAATCSRIGDTGAEVAAAVADPSQGSPLRATVVGPNQVILQVGGAGDIVSGQQAVQLQAVAGSPTGQVIEITPQMAALSPTSAAAGKGAASTMQIVNGPVQSYTAAGSNTVNPLLQMSPQMIATPVAGPGGTIAYNIIPQYQTVVVIGADGTEQTVVVPTGSMPQQVQQSTSAVAASSPPKQIIQVIDVKNVFYYILNWW